MLCIWDMPAWQSVKTALRHDGINTIAMIVEISSVVDGI